MNLGQLIERLEAMPPEKTVAAGFGDPDSSRGNYEQVAFHPIGATTVGQMLEHAKNAVGATFTGYKSGEYTMGLETKVNIDPYGVWSDDFNIWDTLLKNWEAA